MSSWTKILIVVIGLVLVAFAAEMYLYFGVQKGSVSNLIKSTPRPTPSALPEITTVEITGLALVGGLNLKDISKSQVAEWAKGDGVVTVPAYSGPLPTLSPLPSGSSPLERPTSVNILAGNFKSADKTSITLIQNGKDVMVRFSKGAMLWIKNQNKIELISVNKLDQLLTSGFFNSLVNLNDLILIPGVKVADSLTTSAYLVVFR
jgi:hypothetical protein